MEPIILPDGRTLNPDTGRGAIDLSNQGYNAASRSLFNPKAPGDTRLSNRLFDPNSNPNTWDTELTHSASAVRDPSTYAGYGVPGAEMAYGRPGVVGNVFDATRLGMEAATANPEYRAIVSAFRQGRPTVGPPPASRSGAIVNSAMDRL